MRKYQVPLIPQSKPMGCWAASIAMIVSWRDQMSYSPDTVAAESGFTKQREAGLNPQETGPLEYWGFRWLAPQSLSTAGFYELLCRSGPLWVASLTPAPHIRVVTGMEPDPDPAKTKLYVNDPGPHHKGSSYVESYIDFVGKKDALGMKELKIKMPVYTAHLT